MVSKPSQHYIAQQDPILGYRSTLVDSVMATSHQQGSIRELKKISWIKTRGRIPHFRTEFCSHVMRGEQCPARAGKCHYAHSENDLRQKKIKIPDYQCHETFRSRVCFDFVSTGKW